MDVGEEKEGRLIDQCAACFLTCKVKGSQDITHTVHTDNGALIPLALAAGASSALSRPKRVSGSARGSDRVVVAGATGALWTLNIMYVCVYIY